MSQILNVAPGKFLTFDRSWRDNGGDAQYALIGGQKVLIRDRSAAKPEIFQRGNGFYYKDGAPVTELEHVDYLPKKYRDMAEKFIREQGGEAEVLKPAASREDAVVQAVKRGRGRPKKAAAPKGPIEIKDEDSLRAIMDDEA